MVEQEFVIPHPFGFRHPTTVLIAGPTMCGKTRLLVRMLKEGVFRPAPTRLIWVYGEYQPIYDEVKALWPHSEFEREMTPELYESIKSDERNLVVLDDKMNDESGSKTLAKLFTQGAHHRNLTVVFIVQNLFHQGDSMRTVSLNCHYMILFKNPRDKGQIRALGSQMYPGDSSFLVSAYREATDARYGYLILDLHPDTPEDLRVRTGIFSDDVAHVFLPRRYKKGSAN
jgi:hypothetical protein